MIHKLLQRQLRKLRRRSPDGEIPIDALLEVVSATYEESDAERRKKERSMKLMSDELLALNEQIRAESEAYVSTIMESVVDGIVTFDSTGTIHSFNGPMELMFRIPSQEAIGKHISTLTPEHAEANDIYQIYQREMPEGTHKVVVETEAVDQSGRHFPIDLSISELKGNAGSLYIAIIRDISARKEFENALIHARNRAEEIALAKTNFLSTMSHEIRTPMNAVIGLTNLLLQENPRPDQVDNLKVLKFSGENLLVLINDVLDFNKIEAGKLEIESLDFDLDNLLESTREALRLKAEEKGVDLILECDPALPKRVKGDPVRLSQILNNLVGNAIKFTHEGQVRLRLQLISNKPEALRVKFEVIDTGIGIPEDKLDYIFERFNQSDSSITRKYGGTGLGLAITKRLLELLGTDITVISKLGKGSTFSFELQFEHSSDFENPKDWQKHPLPKRSLEGCSILLVEDNRINQMVASKFLRNWGIEVEIADNGRDAVEKVRKSHFDAVLMDLQMPEMDGYSATRAIRELEGPKFQHLPIIALTASAMQPIRAQVIHAGMNDFVSKPFDPEDLNKKLSFHIHQRRIMAADSATS